MIFIRNIILTILFFFFKSGKWQIKKESLLFHFLSDCLVSFNANLGNILLFQIQAIYSIFLYFHIKSEFINFETRTNWYIFSWKKMCLLTTLYGNNYLSMKKNRKNLMVILYVLEKSLEIVL